MRGYTATTSAGRSPTISVTKKGRELPPSAFTGPGTTSGNTFPKVDVGSETGSHEEGLASNTSH